LAPTKLALARIWTEMPICLANLYQSIGILACQFELAHLEDMDTLACQSANQIGVGRLAYWQGYGQKKLALLAYWCQSANIGKDTDSPLLDEINQCNINIALEGAMNTEQKVFTKILDSKNGTHECATYYMCRLQRTIYRECVNAQNEWVEHRVG
jgi:hypothetical protein